MLRIYMVTLGYSLCKLSLRVIRTVLRKDTERVARVGVEDKVATAFLDDPFSTRPRAVEIFRLTSTLTHGVETSVCTGERFHTVLASDWGGGRHGAWCICN